MIGWWSAFPFAGTHIYFSCVCVWLYCMFLAEHKTGDFSFVLLILREIDKVILVVHASTVIDLYF